MMFTPNRRRGSTVSLLVLILLPLLIPIVAQQCDELYPNAIRGPPVVKGKRFFDSVTGEYIAIRGIAYYPRPNTGELSKSNSVDYYAEEYRYIWEPDLENFKKLGVNTIRIYAVDPTVDHSSFMCALQQAGIYVVVGLLADCEDCGIGPSTTDIDVCYPASLKTRGQYIIQVFSKYPNTLAFSAGNEVALFAPDKMVESNAPCQKQFVRDMRAYIQDCNIRNIPVGVVTADPSSEIRELNAKYYNCRSDPSDTLENAEWYGLNAYQHCNGGATKIEEMGGYTKMLNDFTSYDLTIPTLISEFGCRNAGFPTIDGFQSQRSWLQVDALYSPDYLEVFAGGIVFEYSAEKKIADKSPQNTEWPYYDHTRLQYGVTYYSPVGCDHVDVLCKNIKYPEFDLLATKFNDVNVNLPTMDNYVPPDFAIPECPASIAPLSAFTWPSASQDDFWCPPPEHAMYTCPCATDGVSDEPETPTIAPTDVSVPTVSPSASPAESTTTTAAAPATTSMLRPSVSTTTTTESPPTETSTTMQPSTLSVTDEPSSTSESATTSSPVNVPQVGFVPTNQIVAGTFSSATRVAVPSMMTVCVLLSLMFL